MNPFELYKRGFTHYIIFTGRDTRQQFWTFLLIHFGIIYALSQTLGALAGVYGFFGLLPTFAAIVRRLHDANLSGFWMLANFIPVIGQLLVFVLCALPTKSGPNKYMAVPASNVVEAKKIT